ncbi:MAG: LysR family transcriptional regulator [Peptococcaceae bacterium]|nr:LysR family transcriptional regulator [Peptococcaceae bacterium]
MTTDQLRSFLAVAEHLNFTKAAEELHITHPAVSQQIRNLERELDVQLFQRSTRSVRLTDAGRVFLDDARQMVEIAVRAKRRFSGAGEAEVEHLSIGAYSYPCLFQLAPVLERLRASHPSLHPRLHVVPFQHIYRHLYDGNLDVVLAFQEEKNSKIHANYRAFSDVPLVCFCAPSHPLASATRLCLDDLRAWQLVLIAPSRAALSVSRLQGQLLGEHHPADCYICDSAEAAMVLVEAGYGIAILPASLVPPSAAHLVRIALEGVAPVSYGAYYRSLEGNTLVKDFIEQAGAAFADYDWGV